MELQRRAERVLAEFLKANPEFTVDVEQPECRGGTNFITFGACRGKPVVYKRFDWLPRKRQEEKALRLFEPMGLVPKLYPVESDSMLVMERLMGSTLTEAHDHQSQDILEQTYYQLGRAIARIVEFAPGGKSDGQESLTPPPENGYEHYCRTGVGELFDTVIASAAKVLAEEDVPKAEILKKSLSLLQQNRDAILSYPRFLQMDDFHSHNIIVDGPELRGFIDLEMTRYGNEVLLLAAGMVMTMEKPSRWGALRRGYEDYRGKRIDSQTMFLARIAAPFSQWIRFMWYWTADPKSLEEGETTRTWPIRDIIGVFQKLLETDPSRA
jgi:hypothetical protein